MDTWEPQENKRTTLGLPDYWEKDFGILGIPRGDGKKLGCIDHRRTYFHVRTGRRVFVQLSAESQEEGMHGLLNRSIYGTRDVAKN